MPIQNEERGYWKPGESGNRNGRPKGAKNRSTILKKWLEPPCELTNPLTGEATAGTIEDRIALALISKALREDVPAIKEIFDSANGKLKAEEAQFEVNTVILPKPVSERE
jgi:hypothetical protein